MLISSTSNIVVAVTVTVTVTAILACYIYRIAPAHDLDSFFSAEPNRAKLMM